MYSSAFDLTRKLNLAWQTSEKVEDMALAAGRLSCANLDIAMVELEQSLKAAAPQWMALVVLLGLMSVVFLIDAYHSLHLINISHGLSSRTARPIYKKSGVIGLDMARDMEDAPPEPANGKGKLPACASFTREVEGSRPSTNTSVLKQSGVATDFCEDLMLDPSRFEMPITSAINVAPPEKRRSTVAQAKFAWSSANAFSKMASIQHTVDYERRRGSAPPIFSRIGVSRDGSRSANVAEAGLDGEETTPRPPQSAGSDRRGPRGGDRKVAPADVPYPS
jgi:hypothetical protein